MQETRSTKDGETTCPRPKGSDLYHICLTARIPELLRLDRRRDLFSAFLTPMRAKSPRSRANQDMTKLEKPSASGWPPDLGRGNFGAEA